MNLHHSGSYVYFALKGDTFDPAEVTARLGVVPTRTWQKGDPTTYGNRQWQYSGWQLSTAIGTEPLDIDRLVTEIVGQLHDRTEAIVSVKEQFGLESVLEIILYIDVNEEASTPALGHDLQTIDFLYHTRTITDVDIYRYDSGNEDYLGIPSFTPTKDI
ncbi:DUF4279 domain-containing protein [Hymenobacter canadensis]|jgi:hypothetical protein|uniref:DUF4279 domain-containing protein n=1 Tax=Hymenobacter canadensis TaxID=2999067 RepID=A0ABY7LWB2_9BACT|nr:DUF4279 domain-containing protein [Hymenobacter canadensis]WBA44381.1 DUF4279 domain-containing protein [Hymenobacter canadensis]